MRIDYLFHSGVSVLTGNKLLIFDYYKKGIESKVICEAEEIYVFVSHEHRDHFDKDIFKWRKLNCNVKYILSSDVDVLEADDIHRIGPNEVLDIADISIRTLDSTDEGVAFLVETPDAVIFHAGDLNWWHWEGEPDEYNSGMAEKFKAEIHKVQNKNIDVAFIPVDKRLDGAQYYSIDYLMKNVDVKKVCPIHFMDDWNFIEKVRNDLKKREYYNKICFYGR